ncbi:3-isopropylmalate dehydrogenase [Patescibacteria group bacterium]|nr:3-isopropylmalate dehydrogenase [Patescibacteria group bacterium]
MKKTIAILAGDGIGPEIINATLVVLERINKCFGHEIIPHVGLVGGDAYDKFGTHLPDETIELCQNSSAILFGAVGGSVNDSNNPRYKNVEKNVILGLRKKFDLFANLRPLKVMPVAIKKSPLKSNIIAGVDVLIVRELVSGIYFGPQRQYESVDGRVAEDTNRYSEMEIERILRVGFESAVRRRKKVTIVDKANVLETSRLWRAVTEIIKKEFSDVSVEYMYIDNAVMQLVSNPTGFDVIITDNMFGDIMSDLGGAVVGSIGLLPSASLNKQGFGMYEPVHGSAPDIAKKNIANPTAQILSLAMMLRYTFRLESEARVIEKAIVDAWIMGKKTKDLTSAGEPWVGTKEFAEVVSSLIDN